MGFEITETELRMQALEFAMQHARLVKEAVSGFDHSSDEVVANAETFLHFLRGDTQND